SPQRRTRAVNSGRWRSTVVSTTRNTEARIKRRPARSGTCVPNVGDVSGLHGAYVSSVALISTDGSTAWNRPRADDEPRDHVNSDTGPVRSCQATDEPAPWSAIMNAKRQVPSPYVISLTG